MNPLFLIFFLLSLALAAPAVVGNNSWWRLLLGMFLSFTGVVFPLFVFVFSGFRAPEWKGDCVHGWVDCFIVGKLALLPLVIVATITLYALEVVRVKNRTDRLIVIGIFLGVIVATTCSVFGIFCIGLGVRDDKWLLFVPIYTAAWYSIRAVQLIQLTRFSFWTYLGAIAGSLPFWVVSWFWSHSVYAALPDKRPENCFIVTAASLGHEKCVGPLVEITRHGYKRRANQQLLTFWELENRWQNRSSCSHRIFRQYYNRFGPLIARQIKSPWQADLVHLALKPIELTARLALQMGVKNIPKQK